MEKLSNKPARRPTQIQLLPPDGKPDSERLVPLVREYFRSQLGTATTERRGSTPS